MKSTFKSILVAGIAVLAAVSMAQGGGGGGGGRGGFGQGRGGFGMQDPSGVFLLRREDVQGELKLTADQKSKLTTIQEDQRAKMREMFQNGGGGGDREAMMAEMQKMQAENNKVTLAVLDDTQKKRLKELAVQRMGNGIAANAEMQKELGITDDQKTKIKDLQAKQQEASQAVMQKMRDGEIQREELQAIMQKNTDIYNAELGKILTDAQKAKIKEMGGKPFKFVEQQPGG